MTSFLVVSTLMTVNDFELSKNRGF